jgi:hypothetical protein
LLSGLLLLSTFGFLDIWSNGIYGSDFSEIWAGAHVFVTGGDPYDPATWTNAIEVLGVQRAGLPVYNYPGWIPILLAPFGAIDLDLAARIWLGATLFVGAVGLFVLLDQVLPRMPLAFTLFGFALVASEPGIVTFYSGQWDFLVVGLLSLMIVFLRRRSYAISGALASIMIVKPQLFLVAVPALVRTTLARGSARFAIAFAAVAGVAAVASTIAFPTWWGYYLDVPAQKAGDIRAAALPNALRDIFDTPGLVAGVALDTLLLVACFRFRPAGSAGVPAWIAASLITAPYIFVYDHILMIVPLAVATSTIAERGTVHTLLFASLGFAILVAGTTLVHAFPGVALGSLAVNGLVLFALAALVVGGVWPWRHDERSAATPADPSAPSA